jgi:hypothetical protein
MNSLQKQNSEKSSDTPEHFVMEFEQKLLKGDLSFAELTMKKLKFLGVNFDPFDLKASTECEQIMDQLGLTQHLSNPYLATNILLQLLDKTEERINNLKH